MLSQDILSDLTLMTNYGQENMSMKGEFDMNCVQSYEDSLKEAFKHTMLNQEVLFRTQVQELHRAHRVQTALMEDRDFREFHRSNIWIEKTQSYTVPLTDTIRYEAMLNEARVSSIPTAGPIQHMNQSMYYELHQMPFQRHLNTEEYFRHTGNDFLNRENNWDCFKEIMKNPVGDMSSDVDLNLSLSLGNHNSTEECAKRCWFDKKSISCSKNILIDSEDSIERIPNCGTELVALSLGCTTSITCLEEKHEPRVSETCQEFKSQLHRHVSYEASQVDLNEALLDDLSCYSNDATITYPPSIASSTTIEHKEIKSGSNETNELGSNANPENAVSLSNNLNNTCTVTKLVNCENSGPEETVSLGSPDQFSGPLLQTQAAEIFSTSRDHRSSTGSETGHISVNKNNETPEVDILIKIAAESLVHISMENSTCSQDHAMDNRKSDQPQCSCDSFELIALKLTEDSSDDYCVSSNPFEVNEADDNKKDFGIKLKRGRRMKDFQRDILPVMASLSRHEICEDINILESVLRSKEYRKNRAKMGDRESFHPPLKSRRRTKVNGTSRKRFS